jgi:PAS domain S-box-containing protein
MLRLNLTTKMSLMTSLVMAGMLAVIALFGYLYLDKSFTGSISRQQFSVVEVMADEVDSKIQMTSRQLAALASTVEPGYLTDRESAEKYLKLQPDELETFDNGIFLLDASGRLMGSNPLHPGLVGRDYSHRAYFQKTLSSQKPEVSDPFVSNSNGRPVVVFTAPVFSADRRLIGMLCGALDLMKPNYLGKLAHTRLGAKGYFYLYTPERAILVHPDQNRILKMDVKPGINLLFDAAAQGFEGTGETVSSKGVPLISSFKRLKHSGWILAANSPRSEAYAPLARAKWYLALALLAALCCTTVVISWFMRHLTAPLVRFTRYVEEITGQEQEPEPIAIATQDEIGTLAGAFNRMVHEAHRQKEALHKLSLAIEQIPVTVMITDRNGNIEYVNPNFSKVTGYRVDEVVGRNASLVASGFHTPAFFRELWGTILAGKGWRGELRNKRKNGELYWESAAISPVPGRDGSIRHFVAVMEDITERKWAQEALSRSEERTRLLLESTAEAIFGVDLYGDCSFANPACARLLGYQRPDQLLGKNMHRLMHHSRADGSPYPEEDCPMRRVLQGEQGGHFDQEVFWREDGTSFSVEYWAYPQLCEGELVGAVMTFFDISERRRAEEELRHATAAAHAATRAKSQFLANMSHEIRTPINAAIGMLYLLQQTELSAVQKNYLDKAKSASNMLLRVINDILDFSKIEAGKLDLEQAPFSLAAVLGDLHAVASATLLDKPVELGLRCDPQVSDLLVGDSLRLGQVLLNLTCNAIKFTERGRVDLEVDLLRECDGEESLRFTVTDTGIGISPDQQENLFRAFSQADTSTTRRYGGTGLGLTISAQLVDLMGGVLRVASEPGQGSSFSFTVSFLRATDEEQRLALAQGARGAAAERLESIAGLRILLVEDNPINQEVARELLERHGALVTQAGDGAQALALLDLPGPPIHAVLMDVHMPVMDGLEATRRIRQHPVHASLPVIAMTASALNLEGGQCREAGMDDRVNKPINMAELVATLRRCVDPEILAQLPATAALPQRAEDGCPLPDQLPGIDLRRALGTLESGVLLRKLLLSFRKENLDLPDRLASALAAGDREQARRLVHTVKGVGGNLGAVQLCGAAQALELALCEDIAHCQGALAGFLEQLERVLESVCALEQQEAVRLPEAAPAGEQELDVVAIRELSLRLSTLLKADNLNALGVWDQLKPLLPSETAGRIDPALQGLDFQKAVHLLEHLVQDLGRAA